MSKDYCHYEVLEPVMGMPTSEDGLLLSIRPAKEETCSFRMSPTSEQRLFRWKGDRKAGLLMDDEKETLKWQRIGIVKMLCKILP